MNSVLCINIRLYSRLLTLQSVILDTQHSLSKLERDVEKLVVEDDAGRLVRVVILPQITTV